MLTVYEGQISPSVFDTIEVDGAAFDLTGSTVAFQMRAAESGTLVVNAAAVVVTPAAGTVRYDWNTGDTATAGSYYAWWQVTLSNGKTQDTPEFAVEVKAHAPVETVALCTVDDIRMAMQLPDSATTLDDNIGMYIELASARIQDEYGHFQPYETGVTKRFRVRPRGVIPRARFFPHFCTSITGVTLSPEDQDWVLNATTPDWIGEPYETLNGAYTSIRLSPFYPYVSKTQIRFLDVLVDVTGNWGFQNVPAAVKWATIVTVRSWLRRDLSSYANQGGYGVSDLQPIPEGTYSIPYAAHEHLSLYSQTAFVY